MCFDWKCMSSNVTTVAKSPIGDFHGPGHLVYSHDTEVGAMAMKYLVTWPGLTGVSGS